MAFRCEGILKWPVLHDIVPEKDARIDSFLLVPEQSDGYYGRDGGNRHSAELTGVLQDGGFTRLCQRFLSLFHPRNPILDGKQLMRFAKIADEDGLRCDSASCLVLLASALGVTTQPWKKPPETYADTLLRAQYKRDIAPFFENKANAEAHFLAAKKRLGFLGDSLLDIQCLFLAFIYEKTYFRHLQAWFYLQQATARLQVRLMKTGARPWVSCESSGPNDLHIEQRVFWSCFRAEREFLIEIDLPPSGLGDLPYPDPLPEPPLTFATLRADIEARGLSPTNYDSQFEERGWCYYLAEISLRRTIDDTLQHLAEGGEESWLSNASQLVRQYHELEKQRSIWRFHLPHIVQFDDDQVPDNEFAYGLRSRFLEWNELLLRPILYYVLHLPSDQTALPECVELAEKAVHACVQKIHEYQHTLRHGGSWFITRRIFTYACLVLAAARQPERRIKLPVRWGSAIRVAIETLRFWSQDAADVRHMASTLDLMFSRMCL
ncbi:Fungal-trans domain-containing protein [Fusarium sp. LHS14.1]|nr:Fungal-trans domain-containing protein [Fusarium sp. LHS14.1]